MNVALDACRILVPMLAALALSSGCLIGAAAVPGRSAAQAFEAGRYEEAAAQLESYLVAHPDDLDARVRLGWARYRLGDFLLAGRCFAQVLERDPKSMDARVGLGYARLQSEGAAAAVVHFREVLDQDPNHRDALQGVVLAGLRYGAGVNLRTEAAAAARRIVTLDPSNHEAADALVKLEVTLGAPSERRLRPPVEPNAPLRVLARAGRDYLEIRGNDGSWSPMFVKGVNLGCALPGHFPTEFPTELTTYSDWLDTIAGVGANTVRVYTLLPPAFYRALASHNATPAAPRLWLIQGVWTELPPGHDFSNAPYVAYFQEEIARVLDAVHGNLILPPRPGHASGVYDADVSGSLLATIIGREWEPFAVKAYDAQRSDETTWTGTWFTARGGRAMECWAARMCDFAAGYEAKQYRTLHPLTFANWPTLDPLDHPTESNRVEEDAWRARYHLRDLGRLREAPWEDDAVSLDATRIRATPAMEAGFFAAYHIYPNYPDFLNLDPAYAPGEETAGRSRYAAYLEALKTYHGAQPVLVAEFGISTSRGIAHVQPEGLHHGGHDERRQGEILVGLLHSIRRARCAGGIVFSFMDEWFKGTWSVAPFEVPTERRRLWFNAESPEQSYGLLAARPGSLNLRLDGDPSDWKNGTSTLLVSRTGERHAKGWACLRELWAAADEGYLYLLLRTNGGPEAPDFARIALRLALDTYDPARGERSLPLPGAARVPTGVEFLVDLEGPGKSFVTVSAPYEPYAHKDGGPLASPLTPSGRFVHLRFETNRERFGRDGTRYPAQTVDRGALLYGSLDPASKSYDTRTDVAVGAATGTIEMRLPWGLLNVADPSARQVLHQESAGGDPLGTMETEGFRMYAFSFDPWHPEHEPLDRLPRPGEEPALFRWPAWETPKFRLEPKAGVKLIRDGMRSMQEVTHAP